MRASSVCLDLHAHSFDRAVLARVHARLQVVVNATLTQSVSTGAKKASSASASAAAAADASSAGAGKAPAKASSTAPIGKKVNVGGTF